MCLVLPVCGAHKGLQGLMAGMVLMVLLGWLALWVRRVPRV